MAEDNGERPPDNVVVLNQDQWMTAISELISSTGASGPFAALNELVWSIYLAVPNSAHRLIDELRAHHEAILKRIDEDGGTRPADYPAPIDLPIVEVHALTEDQMAMLDALGVKRVKQTWPVTLFFDPDEAGVVAGLQRHLLRHHCPVVTWRGKERIVRPDGSINTLTRHAAND